MTEYAKKMLKTLSIVTLVSTVCFFLGASKVDAEPKGSITIAMPNSFDVKGADTHTATGQGFATIKSMLYDNLIIKKPDGKVYPGLAKSWKIAPDWAYIEFTLDENAKFHNGQAVTSEDIKFSLERAKLKELSFVFGGEFRRLLDRVEVIDKQRLRVHVKDAFPTRARLAAR